MQGTAQLILERARELMQSGQIQRVLGWEKGEFEHDPTPAFFESEEELQNFCYNDYCGANLSKYLIAASKLEGKTLACIKPCDSYSLNQLITEHRVNREKVFVLAVPCPGMLDPVKTEGKDLSQGERKDYLLDKCLCCKGAEHKIADETVEGPSLELAPEDRFAQVRELEALSPQQRFDFWRGELSRCIRCNACRNVCPACSCVKCVFDNPNSGVSSKASADDFEENMFHIIRAFHVAGRCTDCGECSRVCPQRIPLHLLNRKFIADIDELYGEYQAGEEAEQRSPLVNYQTTDKEPSDALKGRG